MLSITLANTLFTDSIPQLTLKKHDNISFEFSGVSLKSAGEIIYQHRVIGLDTGWIASRQNTLEYLLLPAGSFTLQIMATNKFGITSNILSVPFTVRRGARDTGGVAGVIERASPP